MPSIGPGHGFWKGFVLLLGLAGPLLLCNLNYPLLEPDEGRYAEIGREMLLSGDWIVPTLNHQPYYDKPPLFYWLLAGSFSLFGSSAAAARLVPALAALLTVVATYGFGRRLLGQRSGLLAALALTVTVGFVQCGRILILDSVLTLFVTLAFFTAYEAVQAPRLRWRWWAVSGLCCGLGVLTKGPVALVLLGPPLTAYLWLQRDKARMGWKAWPVYGCLIVLVAAPWFIAICLRQPDFAAQFFIDHHVKRFLASGYHESPIWFYVPVVLVGALPWSLLLVGLGQFLLSRSPAIARERPKAMSFFVLWAGWCLLFFSLSRGKLPPYVLPMMPALAAVVGCYVDRVLAGALREHLLGRVLVPRIGAALLAILWLGAAIVLYTKDLASLTATTAAVALSGACLAAALFLGRRLSAKVAWISFGGLALVVTLVCSHQAVPAWADRRAPVHEATEAAALLQDGNIPVLCYAREWGSIPFYVHHANVRNLNGSAVEDLARLLREQPRSLIVVRHDELEQALGRVPAGMGIRVLDAGVAKVALIQKDR